MSEDTCQVRKDHSLQNPATLRHLALNLLRQERTDKTGVKARDCAPPGTLNTCVGP